MTVLLNDEIMEFDVVKDSGRKTLLDRALTDWSFSFELSFGMLMFKFRHLQRSKSLLFIVKVQIFEIFDFRFRDFDSVNTL